MGFIQASPSFVFDKIISSCFASGDKISALSGLTQAQFTTDNFVGTLGKGTTVSFPLRIWGLKGDCKGYVIYDLTCAQADYLSNFTLEFRTPCVRVKNSVIRDFTHDGYLLFKVVATIDGETRAYFTLQPNSGEAQAKILLAYPDAVIQSVEIVRNRSPRIRTRWSGDLAENLLNLARLFAINGTCEEEIIVRRGRGFGNASYLVLTDEDHNEQQEVHGDYPDDLQPATSEITTEAGYSTALIPADILFDLKFGSSDDGYSIPKVFFKGKCLKLEISVRSFARFLIIEQEDILEEVKGNSLNVIITGDDDRDNFLLGKTLEIFYDETYTRVSRDLFDDGGFENDDGICDTLDPYVDVATFASSSVCPPALIVRANTATDLENCNYLMTNQFSANFKMLMNNINIFNFHQCNASCPGNIVFFENILSGLCPDEALRGILITTKRVRNINQGDNDIDHDDKLLEYFDLVVCGRTIHVDESVTKQQLMNETHAPEHFNFLFLSFVNDFDDKNSGVGLPISCLCNQLVCGLPLFIKLRDPEEIGDDPVVVYVTVFTNNLTIFNESLLTIPV